MNCSTKCVNCLKELCVKRVPLFSALEHDDFEEIAERMSFRKYAKGETIVAQGSTPHAVTIIRKGSAKACRVAPDGQEKILYLFSKHDFFGEQYLFGDQRVSYSVVALQTVETCSFSREHFQQMLMTHPFLAQHCIEELGRRVIALEKVVQNSGNQKIDTRVALLLLEFYRKYGTDSAEGPSLILPLSREGVANYLGIARETLSRKLGQMEEMGMIEPIGNKRILLKKPDALTAMANGETVLS